MITRNFKELLSTVLSSAAGVCGVRPVVDVSGRMWYATSQFSFPASRTAAVTLTATAAGISVGTGDTAATEFDYQLEEHVSSGINLTLTATNVGYDSPGSPCVEYYLTVTNTGSAAITITEVCYKQTLKACPKIGSASSSDVICMLDRTVLSEPMTVQAGDAGVIIYKLKATTMGDRTVSGVKIVEFGYGTDAEIADMIDAARLGTIDLQEDGGWRVGDQRKIHIDAWTGGNGVAHAAEDLCIVITSFDEYNECGNLFQFDFLDCVTGGQRMNSSNTTSGGYGATEMYTTTLPALVEALPSWMQSRLKTFSVLASAGGSTLSTIETVAGNKLALRAAVEIFGAGGNGQAGEGSQIPYYANSALRIKTSGYAGSTAGWWERSAYSSTIFCYVNSGGGAGSSAASGAYGVAPFGCI